MAVLAGTQGGKTSFGPHWLYREIRRCGPGDYLVVTPTYQLLEKKCLPEFRRLFERWLGLGRYVTSPARRFEFSHEGSHRTFGSFDLEQPTTVWFGYAEDPESLESATVKAAWLDEAGQRKFRLGSWEAIRRRLSIYQGRVLITTTPYDLGWLKQVVWDRWKAGDPDYEVIRFDSVMNPVFPVAEFESARRSMPPWKFNLFYRAIFTRPAGLIYDSFRDEYAPEGHLVPRFAVPSGWPRYLGLDFGQVNTAAVFFAEDPATRKLYLYRTYRAGGRAAEAHCLALLAGEPGIPIACGGSHQEEGWRETFRKGGELNGKRTAGIPVREPVIRDVEVGIDRVYAAHAQDQILVFDDLQAYRDEKMSYSRELDEQGEPTEKIQGKSTYHLLDAERYIISLIRPGPGDGPPQVGPQRPLVGAYREQVQGYAGMPRRLPQRG